MVDFIICENPIHSLKLLNKLGIKKKLFSLHDYNEEVLIKKIEKYQNNSSIALISDAGSPLISDPGYKLVLDYINKNIMITTVPGPSAIIAALQLSGLPMHNFKFLGFVLKKNKLIDNLLNKIENSKSTSVLFISGVRLLAFLDLIIEKKIKRKISICKEITKFNEKIYRGNAEEILLKMSSNKKAFKGEFVIIIEGKQSKDEIKINNIVTNEIKKLLQKFSLTEVVNIVHKLTNVSKNEIYKATLLIKDE